MLEVEGLYPISLAGAIIGFVTFFVTLLTWLNVFSEAFHTFKNANSQVVDSISVLRQALFEESGHVSRLRKTGVAVNRDEKGNIHYDSRPIEIVATAIHDLVRDFKDLERPFLTPPHPGVEKDLEWSFDTNQSYYQCTFKHRLQWIGSRKGILEVERRLNNLQMRRIAVEVSENQMILADVMGTMKRTEDRASVMEQDRGAVIGSRMDQDGANRGSHSTLIEGST